MTRLLPANPVLRADLCSLGATTRVWSANASLAVEGPADWLRLADGHHTLGQVIQGASDAVYALQVLKALCQASLVQDAPPVAPRTVAVIGQGRLAHDMCAALASWPVHLLLAGPARSGGFQGVNPAWDAVSRPAAVASVSHHEHWSQVSRDRCQLAVVASETCEPDRAIVHHLGSEAIPHIVVRAHRDTATVGPMWTRPGHTCTGCIDLAIRDQDESWGNLVMMLSEREAAPDPEVSLAAAALTLHRIRTGQREDETSTIGDLVTVVRPGHLDQQRWPRHPHCRCQRMSAAHPQRGSHRRAQPVLGGRVDRLSTTEVAAA